MILLLHEHEIHVSVTLSVILVDRVRSHPAAD